MKKRCSKCKETKDREQFSNNKKRKDGKCDHCKDCNRIRYKENREHILSTNGAYYKRMKGEFNGSMGEIPSPTVINFALNRLWHTCKQRAEKKGIEFNITKDDIAIPSHCPILNIPLQISDGHNADNSPTIDRIDCTEGYIKGNVQVISNKANTIKSNATVEDLLAVANWLKGRK